MVGGAKDENGDTIFHLKEKYRFFGLPTWSAETFPLIFEKYPFFKELEGIIVSGEEKIIKPDERIYKILLSKYDLKAQECLFIDHNKDNIIAAEKLDFLCVYLDEGMALMMELNKRISKKGKFIYFSLLNHSFIK